MIPHGNAAGTPQRRAVVHPDSSSKSSAAPRPTAPPPPPPPLSRATAPPPTNHGPGAASSRGQYQPSPAARRQRRVHFFEGETPSLPPVNEEMEDDFDGLEEDMDDEEHGMQPEPSFEEWFNAFVENALAQVHTDAFKAANDHQQKLKKLVSARFLHDLHEYRYQKQDRPPLPPPRRAPSDTLPRSRDSYAVHKTAANVKAWGEEVEVDGGEVRLKRHKFGEVWAMTDKEAKVLPVVPFESYSQMLKVFGVNRPLTDAEAKHVQVKINESLYMHSAFVRDGLTHRMFEEFCKENGLQRVHPYDKKSAILCLQPGWKPDLIVDDPSINSNSAARTPRRAVVPPPPPSNLQDGHVDIPVSGTPRHAAASAPPAASNFAVQDGQVDVPVLGTPHGGHAGAAASSVTLDLPAYLGPVAEESVLLEFGEEAVEIPIDTMQNMSPGTRENFCEIVEQQMEDLKNFEEQQDNETAASYERGEKAREKMFQSVNESNERIVSAALEHNRQNLAHYNASLVDDRENHQKSNAHSKTTKQKEIAQYVRNKFGLERLKSGCRKPDEATDDPNESTATNRNESIDAVPTRDSSGLGTPIHQTPTAPFQADLSPILQHHTMETPRNQAPRALFVAEEGREENMRQRPPSPVPTARPIVEDASDEEEDDRCDVSFGEPQQPQPHPDESIDAVPALDSSGLGTPLRKAATTTLHADRSRVPPNRPPSIARKGGGTRMRPRPPSLSRAQPVVEDASHRPQPPPPRLSISLGRKHAGGNAGSAMHSLPVPKNLPRLPNGNSYCWANACILLMAASPQMYKLICQMNTAAITSSGVKALVEFVKTIGGGQVPSKEVYTEVVGMHPDKDDGNNYKDAGQFFREVLCQLDCENKHEKSFHNLCNLKSCSVFACNSCGRKNRTDEDLIMPNQVICGSNDSFQHVLMKEYGKTEEVDDFQCSQCNCKGKATKSSAILQTPTVLVVSLTPHHDDMSTPVPPLPPMHVNKHLFVPRDNGISVYELRGTANYSDGDNEARHYMACYKDNNSWIHNDDLDTTSPRQIDEADVLDHFKPSIVVYEQSQDYSVEDADFITTLHLAYVASELSGMQDFKGKGLDEYVDATLRAFNSQGNSHGSRSFEVVFAVAASSFFPGGLAPEEYVVEAALTQAVSKQDMDDYVGLVMSVAHSAFELSKAPDIGGKQPKEYVAALRAAIAECPNSGVCLTRAASLLSAGDVSGSFEKHEVSSTDPTAADGNQSGDVEVSLCSGDEANSSVVGPTEHAAVGPTEHENQNIGSAESGRPSDEDGLVASEVWVTGGKRVPKGARHLPAIVVKETPRMVVVELDEEEMILLDLQLPNDPNDKSFGVSKTNVARRN